MTSESSLSYAEVGFYNSRTDYLMVRIAVVCYISLYLDDRTLILLLSGIPKSVRPRFEARRRAAGFLRPALPEVHSQRVGLPGGRHMFVNVRVDPFEAMFYGLHLPAHQNRNLDMGAIDDGPGDERFDCPEDAHAYARRMSLPDPEHNETVLASTWENRERRRVNENEKPSTIALANNIVELGTTGADEFSQAVLTNQVPEIPEVSNHIASPNEVIKVLTERRTELPLQIDSVDVSLPCDRLSPACSVNSDMLTLEQQINSKPFTKTSKSLHSPGYGVDQPTATSFKTNAPASTLDSMKAPARAPVVPFTRRLTTDVLVQHSSDRNISTEYEVLEVLPASQSPLHTPAAPLRCPINSACLVTGDASGTMTTLAAIVDSTSGGTEHFLGSSEIEIWDGNRDNGKSKHIATTSLKYNIRNKFFTDENVWPVLNRCEEIAGLGETEVIA
ncbi:hypothetical protein HDU93_005805 [Gonapodya sp. JEL0774]|nr:hypothetical protein HDU93_005805 [Gonapodya sp. JEL0774]